MTDYRKEVVDDRGAIKKLQLLIPGYRGYRINEDLRDADIFLKNEIYKKMLFYIDKLKEAENNLVKKGMFMNLEDIKDAVSKIQTVAAQIKHHEAGYSGISAPLRITADKLSRVYDLDSSIADLLSGLENSIDSFYSDTLTGKFNSEKLNAITDNVSKLIEINNMRDKIIYGE
ncbi:MAG: hypothetical protein ACP5L4_02715 [Thermoplasmata archaeon]